MDEMDKSECNIMALLMAKGVRDKELPKEELNALKKLIEKYPLEHKKILKGEKPY